MAPTRRKLKQQTNAYNMKIHFNRLTTKETITPPHQQLRHFSRSYIIQNRLKRLAFGMPYEWIYRLHRIITNLIHVICPTRYLDAKLMALALINVKGEETTSWLESTSTFCQEKWCVNLLENYLKSCTNAATATISIWDTNTSTRTAWTGKKIHLQPLNINLYGAPQLVAWMFQATDKAV